MGDIAVSDFPDYVWRMMREDEDTSCMLANEYMVSIFILRARTSL